VRRLLPLAELVLVPVVSPLVAPLLIRLGHVVLPALLGSLPFRLIVAIRLILGLILGTLFVCHLSYSCF
jgi:hypothetical protein